MAELIDADRIVANAAFSMVEGRPDGVIVYDHCPTLKIGLAATRRDDGNRILSVKRYPGSSTTANLDTASPSVLKPLAAAVRSSSNGAGTPIV